MGSHGTMYALIAVAIALVCLLIGFLWGRSNVKSQIEDALEKERMALASREFTVRQQAEDAMAELARLRPLADELGRVQERLKLEQSKYAEMRAEFNAAFAGSDGTRSTQPEISDPEPEPAAPVESADIAIQKLLQSLQENLNGPEEIPLPLATNEIQDGQATVPQKVVQQASVSPIQPAIPQKVGQQASVPPIQPKPAPPQVVARTQAPAQAAQPVQLKPSATPPVQQKPPAFPSKPIPVQSAQKKPVPQPVVKPKGSEADEWQEFARSLANLTGRKQ